MFKSEFELGMRTISVMQSMQRYDDHHHVHVFTHVRMYVRTYLGVYLSM